MRNDTLINKSFHEHGELVKQVGAELSIMIYEVGLVLAKCLEEGGTIFWCGNGGSAADSQHLAAELVGRFKKDRRALRSIALTTDTSVLTCIANDYSYDDIFSRQIEAVGRKKDILVAITTSGQSENVLRAIKKSKELGLITISLLGKGGGSAQEISDYSLVVPSGSTDRIQEMHILIGHILCELIEDELGIA
jgi:D-sedoheptulose 7-phosphate isomerase